MATTTPYNPDDCFVLNYPDGEYSLERFDKTSELRASDVTHIVLEGETMQSIAHKYYKDSGRWGDILTFNNFIDPFEVEPGTVLVIPM